MSQTQLPNLFDVLISDAPGISLVAKSTARSADTPCADCFSAYASPVRSELQSNGLGGLLDHSKSPEGGAGSEAFPDSRSRHER